MANEDPTDRAVDWFDHAEPVALRAALLSCLHVPRWAGAVVAARPYGDRTALAAHAHDLAQDLDDADLAAALSAHPRIGERASGPEVEAAWSRHEQSGVDAGDEDVTAALAAGNAAYEARFGHIFLIRAAGRSSAEILANLRERMGNDAATEARIVAEQLQQIADLRLERLLDDHEAEPTLSTHVLDAARGRPAAGLRITLDRLEGDDWIAVGSAETDDDGRVKAFGPLHPRVYRLTFDTGTWFAERETPSFYPVAQVVFGPLVPGEHHHVPLLLSPFAFSTYRGS